MTLVLMDGFDTYNGTGANTGLQSKWSAGVSIATAAPTLTMVSGRFTGQAVRLAYNGTALGGLPRSLPSGYASTTIGFAYRASSLALWNATLAPILQLREGATYHVHITVASDGKLSALRASSSSAGTSLGSTAAGVIATNTWHYIEVESVINDTTGRVTIYVDGVQVLNLTSQDTRNSGTSGVIDTVQFAIGGTGALNTDFDDLYVLDAATRLGERKIETIYPTSDIAQGFARSTGSTNYTLVDEAQVNGDTDYVQGSAVNDVDTYGLTDLATTPTTIDGVQIIGYAEKTDATSRSIALQVKSGATTSDGSNYTLAASYSKFERLLLTDPNTSSAWAASAVNALQGGPKVTV